MNFNPCCFRSICYAVILNASFIVFGGHAQAESLIVSADRALEKEPTYLTGKSDVATYQSRQKQIKGNRYPQIGVSSNVARNHRETVTEPSLFSSGQTDEFYNSTSAQLNLTQSLFNHPNTIAVRQSDFSVSQVEYKLAAAEDELFAKVTTAWLDVLSGRDNLLYSQKQLISSKRQWEILSRGVALGIQSLPQADEARLKYDQSAAELAIAQSELSIKRAALEQLVGSIENDQWPFIHPKAVLVDLSSEQLDHWLGKIDEQNFNIRSAEMAYLAAKAEMDKQYAGHLPTLDMVASYGKTIQGAGNSAGEQGFNSNQWSVGLRLNVALYSGGTQSAKVNEALAQQERASLDLEIARRNAVMATKQAWFSWQVAFAKARAAQQAILSAESNLKVATTGVTKGIKSELDVLQAQQQGDAARRGLNKAQYDQMAAFVSLNAAVGTLVRDDIVKLEGLFAYDVETLSP